MIEDLIYGWGEMEAALPEYQEAEDYYDGDVDEVFANKKLEDAISSTGERYRFALASIPVETLADRLGLTAVKAPDETVNSKIAEIEEANRMAVQWPDLFLMALEYGDSYLQVWDVAEPSEQNLPAGRLAARRLAAAGVEITVHNPKHVRMFYDDESERVPVFLIKRWTTRTSNGVVWRADIYYPTGVERWVSDAGTDPRRASSWKKYFDNDQAEDAWEIPLPLEGEIPWFHFRTGMPYGKPVHQKVYGCQDAVTKMLVTQLTTTDSHGWPQRWALAEAGAELDNAGDDPDWDDDSDAADSGSVQGGTSSGLRSGPGTMQRFTGTRSVGQFDAADPEVFLTPARLYIRMMAQLGNTPFHYFDPSGDAPSGESLKVADAPQVRRANRMKTLFGGTIQEFWDYTLRLVGATNDSPVDVMWAPNHIASGPSDWDEVRTKQDSGVPIGTTLVEAGYEKELVETWNLPEHPVEPGIAVLDSADAVPDQTVRE